MDMNEIQKGTQLAVAFVVLLVFGICYNVLVDRFQKRTQRYTAELVVGGVLVTVLVSGVLIGLEDMLTVLLCFVASGLPMIIGSWIRTAKDEENARKVQKESLKELTK